MKKQILYFMPLVLAMACGPSAEEKAAIEQARQDSIAAVQKMYDDSVAASQQAVQDSINAVIEQMRQDSIALADSLAMLKGKLKSTTAKPKTTPKKEESKTIGAGKPSMGQGANSDTTIGKGKPKMGK
jgi:hypothetical protein